jgi:hypothetical protein
MPLEPLSHEAVTNYECAERAVTELRRARDRSDEAFELKDCSVNESFNAALTE